MFTLPSYLDPSKYHIVGDLRRVAQWRAYTYVANSGGEVGQMDAVGYIAISLVDNTIIPIARGDEHHTGHDLLWDFQDKPWKYPINPPDYVTIWPYGNNYLYNESDKKFWLPALKKYFEYGGKDGFLWGYNGVGSTTLSHFLETGGNTDFTGKKTLAPIGQQIYNHLEKVALALRNKESGDPIANRSAFIAATELAKYISDLWGKTGVDVSTLKELPSKIRELKKEDDVQGLRELIFGFHGIKNMMHNRLREAMANDTWYRREMMEIWGNLDLAFHMLGSI